MNCMKFLEYNEILQLFLDLLHDQIKNLESTWKIPSNSTLYVCFSGILLRISFHSEFSLSSLT